MNLRLNIFRPTNVPPTFQKREKQAQNKNLQPLYMPVIQIPKNNLLPKNILCESTSVNPLLKNQQILSKQKEQAQYLLLKKFNNIVSKAHHMFQLKNQTLFQTFSLGELTVNMVLDRQVTFQYWVVGCLYLTMKYQEIYPPRLRELFVLVKIQLKSREYFVSETKIFQFIQMDMNFTNINHYLGQYLYHITQQTKQFIFYLIQITLVQRSQFRNYTLKEIIISCIYVLCDKQKLKLQYTSTIDQIQCEKITQCSKAIIVHHRNCIENNIVIHKKYRQERYSCVAKKNIPVVQNLTNLLTKKLASIDQQITQKCNMLRSKGRIVPPTRQIDMEFQ